MNADSLLGRIVAVVSRRTPEFAPPPEPAPEPLPDGETYDYTRTRWGQNYVIHHTKDDGQELRCSGWGPRRGQLQRGDYLLLHSDGPAGSSRYQVLEVEYHMDPPDMWAATLRFAPRQHAVDLAKEAGR